MSLKAPHIAILNIRVEFQELLKTGECSGRPISNKDLKDMGCKSEVIISIKGIDARDCANKVKKALEELRNG